MTMPIPTEEVEQRMVVQYCALKGYPLFHVPNSTYTKSWTIKRRNTALGVSSGVPDLFLIVGSQLIAIEMKRTKNSTTTDDQKKWLEQLNDAGIPPKYAKALTKQSNSSNNGRNTKWQPAEAKLTTRK